MINKTGWRVNIIRAKNDTPKPLLANIITVLRLEPRWQGVLAWDVFSNRAMLLDAPPWLPVTDSADWEACPWSDGDNIAAANWMQLIEAIFVKPNEVAQAIEMVAKDHCYHPVQDYIVGCVHDNKPRLDTMMHTYFGAMQTAYSAAVGRHLMIGAVARIYEPGCKNDTMPILEGSQGKQKSTAIEKLFLPWFSDQIDDFGSKDAAMQTSGVLCIEVAEMDAMTRSEISKVKAFISRRVDRYRPPYGRRVQSYPRQCVFFGSTNENAYLKDATGARRFRPLSVGVERPIDVAGIERDRDLLWAEARIMYEANIPWWFTNKKADVKAAAEAEIEQEARYQIDPWEQPIADYLASRLHQPPMRPAYRIDIKHVFVDGIGMDDSGRWDQTAMNRIAKIMQRLGWMRKQFTIPVVEQGETIRTKRVWKYERSATAEEATQDQRQAEIDESNEASKVVAINAEVERKAAAEAKRFRDHDDGIKDFNNAKRQRTSDES